MTRNIIILFDGTSNQIRASRSNILRLYGVLSKTDSQLVYYDPGVGTIGDENSWLRPTSDLQEFWGFATGWGLDANVKEAYRFLVENYAKSPSGERDAIYLFGFSRGAYTARVLAGFIHAFGLMEPRNLNLLDYAYRAYKRIGERAGEADFAEMRLYERILRPDRPKIRFLGLFDTVASVIEWKDICITLKNHAFTDRNPSVQTVRHAVALDERRAMFRPQLWPPDQIYVDLDPSPAVAQDIRELWFAGVHGDVGGGYPEAESALAKVPLAWMVQEAAANGADFDARTVDRIVFGKGKGHDYVAPDPTAARHETLHGGWRIVEWLPQAAPAGTRRATFLGLTLPRGEHRHVPADAQVHPSVAERFPDPKTRPAHYPPFPPGNTRQEKPGPGLPVA